MHTRFEEIDNFLKELMKEVNLKGEIKNGDIVYEKLMNYGLSESDYLVTEKEKEKNGSLQVGKGKWFEQMDYFVQCARCNSRCISIDHPYFLIFTNTNLYESQTFVENNTLKLYIPVGKDSLEFIQNLINFLQEEDIWHLSKLASDIRTDDMTVRVYTKEDVKKIINYVDTHNNGTLIGLNPFLGRVGNLGIAIDGKQSFNKTLSLLLTEYINELKNKEESSQCGIEDFKNYLKNKYNEIFINHEISSNYKNYIKSNISTPVRRYLDLKIIMEFLMLTLDSSKTIDDYFDYWDSIYDIENNHDVSAIITDILNGKGKDVSFPKVLSDPGKDIAVLTATKQEYNKLLEKKRLVRERHLEIEKLKKSEARKQEEIIIEQRKIEYERKRQEQLNSPEYIEEMNKKANVFGMLEMLLDDAIENNNETMITNIKNVFTYLKHDCNLDTHEDVDTDEFTKTI